MISLFSQSTQYVTSTVSNTEGINPTSASVSFAFIGPYGTVSQAQDNAPTAGTTWFTGAWANDTSYTAQILVGPQGTVTLQVGSYVVYVKVGGSPEIPVLFSGPLTVS